MPRTVTAPNGAQPQFYSHQPNEMRRSKLIGATVTNAGNESIDEINEIILSKDGSIAAVVIGVGGFLGIGEREVAVDYTSLRIEPSSSAIAMSESVLVRVNVTKENLENAPPWRWTDRPAQ